MTNEKGEKKRGTDAMGPGGDNGGWSGEATRAAGGFRTEDMEVNITFGEEKNKGREVKEQPMYVNSYVPGEAREGGTFKAGSRFAGTARGGGATGRTSARVSARGPQSGARGPQSGKRGPASKRGVRGYNPMEA